MLSRPCLLSSFGQLLRNCVFLECPLPYLAVQVLDVPVTPGTLASSIFPVVRKWNSVWSSHQSFTVVLVLAYSCEIITPHRRISSFHQKRVYLDNHTKRTNRSKIYGRVENNELRFHGEEDGCCVYSEDSDVDIGYTYYSIYTISAFIIRQERWGRLSSSESSLQGNVQQ